MKKTSRVLVFGLLVFGLHSCAFHSGMMSSNAHLTENNFQVIDFVKGTASTTHVFGIGGLSKNALVHDAKADMYRKHPLKPGQIYANIVVDVKRSFFFIAATTVITVSADLVQFSNAQNAPVAPFGENILSGSFNILRAGQQICFIKYKKLHYGTIDRIKDGGIIKAHGSSVDGESKVFSLNAGEVYITSVDIISNHGYQLLGPIKVHFESGTKQARFVGLGINNALVEIDTEVVNVPLDQIEAVPE